MVKGLYLKCRDNKYLDTENIVSGEGLVSKT